MRYGEMSRGMKQRLGIAQALVGGPDLVVLDEPTNGLDPQGRALVRELVGRLRDEGAAVLLSSHLLGEVERVCDRVAVLSSGELLATGPPGALVGGAEFQIETDLGVRSYPGYSREQVAAEIESLVAAGRRVFRAGPREDGLERAYFDLLEDRE
jgi:ABC-2 type transport system ATP-binding protein